MANDMMVKELEQVVVRFSGDSGDGMQLAGNIFSTVSATVGNDISTFPDYPADIRAPQGSLTGVSDALAEVGENDHTTDVVGHDVNGKGGFGPGLLANRSFAPRLSLLHSWYCATYKECLG